MIAPLQGIGQPEVLSMSKGSWHVRWDQIIILLKTEPLGTSAQWWTLKLLNVCGINETLLNLGVILRTG